MSINSTIRHVYARQRLMEEIGDEGQGELLNASVLVVGCGGLGSSALFYLAAMGIGRLGLCDGDEVSLSNLNRQILYTFKDNFRPKASTAGKRIEEMNPWLRTTAYDRFLDEELAAKIVPEYDIAVDCLDNFESRFILNDACVAARKPFVHAGVGEFYGQLLTVTPGTGPCLRCLFPDGKQRKEPDKPIGIVGPTPGVLGSLQALEVLKYLLGLPVSNDGLVVYNGLNMTMSKVALQANPQCRCRAEQQR